jgi:hypothetical protein
MNQRPPGRVDTRVLPDQAKLREARPSTAQAANHAAKGRQTAALTQLIIAVDRMIAAWQQ